MDGTALFSTITGAIVLGGLLGGLVSSVKRGRGEQQSEVIALQQSEIAAFKSANERLASDKKALETKAETLERSNADLKELAQQTPEIKQLIKEIGKMNKTLGKLVVK